MWTHFNGKMHVEGLEDVKLPVISARDVLFSHQCSYLARSLNRLLDPVNLAFPGKNVPSVSEIEGVVRIIVSELNAARGDEELRSKLTFAFSNNEDILRNCSALLTLPVSVFTPYPLSAERVQCSEDREEHHQ